MKVTVWSDVSVDKVLISAWTHTCMDVSMYTCMNVYMWRKRDREG